MTKSSGKRPLKIVILSRAVYPYHGYGGLERHVYHQVKHLSDSGCQVTLITQPPLHNDTKLQKSSFKLDSINNIFINSRLVNLPSRKGFIILDRIINYPLLVKMMVWALIEMVANSEVDLIYAHGLTGWGVAKYRHKMKRIPFILNPHGMEEFKSDKLLKSIAYLPFRRKMRSAGKAADLVVATDKVMIDEVQRFLKLDTEKIIILPNAVDIQECRDYIDTDTKNKLVEKYRLKEDAFLFLSVGRLEENKGFIELIRQFHRIKARIKTNWKLLIVGTGSQQSKLEVEINSLLLKKNIVLTGSLNDKDLHNLYDMADVFVLPSLYEGSSIATLEAMVHSCPVIANKVGGLADKVKDGSNGFLCNPLKPDSLGDALIRIFNYSSKDLKKMGKRSAKIAEENFSWRKVAERSYIIFTRLIDSTNQLS